MNKKIMEFEKNRRDSRMSSPKSIRKVEIKFNNKVGGISTPRMKEESGIIKG